MSVNDILAIAAVIVGIDTTVADATKQLQQRYIRNRFSSSVDDWPPYQPKNYTTLAFIHNKGKFTDAVRFSVTEELAVAGKIDSSQVYKHSDSHANMMKNISDIFLPIMSSDGSFVDLHILIEGAPGIGKTVLTKEIAYQWAKNELLTSQELLLLVFLRECHQKPLRSIEDLVQYVFKSNEMTSYLTKYLSKADGEKVVVIFDGFDELSEENRQESIIIDIINRRILPKSCIVITSRPTASSNLHGSVDRRVEIVGFTEEDRLDYVQTALKSCDEQIKALQHYLQSNPTINALCYIPLNMTILLCLIEDRIDRLPKTQTEMYKKFIEMTIIRFIKKCKNCNTIVNTAKLPHPHDKLYVDLTKLAYKALKTDKIVFTLSEIKDSCPNLTMTSNNWNGLGLLKAVQYFSTEIGNDQVTFHFLHFSIQEYMAAWYISKLSKGKQIKLLQKTFWEHRYYNTWTLYVGITCGNSFALRHFLSGNRFQFYSWLFKTLRVSDKYLNDKIKGLHLFQCLVETEKENILESVTQLFQSNQIDLSNQTLLPSDLNTLGFFLMRSINKEWNVLDLSNCNIGSNGINILCDRCLDKDFRCIVTIKMVNFSYNQLKISSLVRLFSLLNTWQTSEIIIARYAILDNTNDIKAVEDIALQSTTLKLAYIGSFVFLKNVQLNKMLDILSNTASIKCIYLLNCSWKLSDVKISELLPLLEKQKLDKVRIIGPSLDKIFIQTIASILLANNNSVNMLVYDPTMSDEIADDISSLISSSNKDISGVMLIVSSNKVEGIVNTCTLSNELSALELFNLNMYVKYSNTKMCPWRENVEYHDENIIVHTFVEFLHKIDINCQLKIALLENDTMIAYKTKFTNLVRSTNYVSVIYLSDCNVTEYNSLIKQCSSVYVFQNNQLNMAYLQTEGHQVTGAAQFITTLNNITTLNTIKIKNFVITDENADGLANVLHHNTQLQELCLDGNDLQTTSAIKIAKALQGISTLRVLSICNNMITDETAKYIAAAIFCNIKLIELNIGKNNLKTVGAIKIVNALRARHMLKRLNLSSNNNITDEAADKISAVVSSNTQLEELDVSGNNLQTMGIMKIAKELQHIYTLKKLYISNSKITYEVAHAIGVAITCNNHLQEFIISESELQTPGVARIAGSLQELSTLTKFYINNNNITHEATGYIATAIFYNIHLQEFNIGENNIQTRGAINIAKVLQKCSMLIKFYINNNNITHEAADDIAAVISCNVHLQEFDIGGNNLQGFGAARIAKGLQKVSTLAKLYLNNNIITHKAAQSIATAISCNIHLQEFNIGGNYLQTTGAIEIAKGLQNISTLIKLYIDNNNITHEAADDIATAISCNVHLQEFNIDGNNIQATGAIKIAKGLQKCSTLTKLYINNNNITDEAANDIAAAISCNVYLQELDISGNRFSGKCTIKIVRALQKISTLKKIYLDFIKINNEAADEIEIAIQCNTALQEISICGTMFDKNAISSIKEKVLNVIDYVPLGSYLEKWNK